MNTALTENAESIMKIITFGSFFYGDEIEGSDSYKMVKEMFDAVIVIANNLEMPEDELKKIIDKINDTYEYGGEDFSE